jgi:hypothetical protein
MVGKVEESKKTGRRQRQMLIGWKIWKGNLVYAAHEAEYIGRVEFPSNMSQLAVLGHLVKCEGYPANIFSTWDGRREVCNG